MGFIYFNIFVWIIAYSIGRLIETKTETICAVA